MKKFLTLLLTAALLATASTGVFADEAVETAEAPAAAAEETVVPATITIEGLTKVEVTTSDTSLDVDAANFYDTLAETRCRIEFAPDAEETTFSVYTATKVPEAISKFAAILDGEPGTILTIEVYGTNDSLLLDWTPIALVQEEEVTVIGDYAVLSIADEPAAYAFYRFDFTLESGNYFELAELALFKVVSDEPEMQYDLGEVVEEGVLPELVPVVEAEEAAAMEEEPVEESADEAPAFGIFTNFPLPMYKFLPRG